MREREKPPPANHTALDFHATVECRSPARDPEPGIWFACLMAWRTTGTTATTATTATREGQAGGRGRGRDLTGSGKCRLGAHNNFLLEGFHAYAVVLHSGEGE